MEITIVITVADIRNHELKTVLELHGKDIAGKDLLEIGSGKGVQLKKFQEICKSAVGVDLEDGSCATRKIAGVVYYDGHKLPFEDNSFDIIFSSNVLEHIPHLEEFSSEFRRVLRDDGVMLHVLPNSTWRIFTLLLHYIVLPYSIFMFIKRRVAPKKVQPTNQPVAAGEEAEEESPQVVQHTMWSLILDTLIARRHGEKGNRITEIYYFSDGYWKRRFEKMGWKHVIHNRLGIFYANYTLGLKTKTHLKLAKILGGSTTVFRMTK